MEFCPCSVTQLGVSLLKVVATMERPASHHGTDRPEGEKFRGAFARQAFAEKKRRRKADEQREGDDEPVDELEVVHDSSYSIASELPVHSQDSGPPFKAAIRRRPAYHSQSRKQNPQWGCLANTFTAKIF